MNEHNSLQLLDKFLLKFINLKSNNYKASIAVFTDWNSKEITIAEINMVLGKLIRDGYVIKYQNKDSDTNPLLTDNYVLTFEGKVFIENGGYQGQYENRNRERRIEKLKAHLLIVGTWVASIAALLLFCVEVYKIVKRLP